MDTVTSNSVTYKIINRSESEDARKIDATFKNKLKWSWLEEKGENGNYHLMSSMLQNQQNTCLVRRFIHHTLTTSLEEAYNRVRLSEIK